MKEKAQITKRTHRKNHKPWTGLHLCKYAFYEKATESHREQAIASAPTTYGLQPIVYCLRASVPSCLP